MLNAKRVASIAVVMFVAGCSDATLPPPQSPSDPANPGAAETPMEVTPPAGTAAATAAPSAAPSASPGEHGGHQHGGGGQK